MTCRLLGLTVAACVQVGIANEGGRSKMLFLDAGETLSACQNFHWRSMIPKARVVLSIGSCPGCTDIFEGQETAAHTSTVALPLDGREIYVTLNTVLNGEVIGQDTHVYRATAAARRVNEARACQMKTETTVGIFHWSGKASRSLTQGVQAVAEIGGSAVRLAYSPRTRRDYNVETACIAGLNLGEFLDDADVRQALSHNAIRTFMLTVFDGASFLDCEDKLFLRPDFYTPENHARLVKEYSQFAYKLIRSHAGSGKTFIVSNWESDNLIYCGSSYLYSTNPQFRQRCDADYAVIYGGNRGPAESLLGLRKWFSARSEGIARGRLRATDENYTGVAVYLAPEINSVRDLRELGLASVLTDVLPFVQFDYVSYSCWESLNRAGSREELAADLDTIRTIAGTDAVILGEIGYATAHFGESAVQRVSSAIASAAKWGVPYVFHWVLYDDAVEDGYGLYDTNGVLTPMGSYFKRAGFRVAAGR